MSKQKTIKVMTDWGEMSITCRNGYYYAVKTIKGIKRQIYLGKEIPCQERLEEVADEINVIGSEWVKRHHKPVRQPRTDRTNVVSVAVEQLRMIEQLARARGEDAIAKQLVQVIKNLSGIEKQG